jgi:hypothetical protein
MRKNNVIAIKKPEPFVDDPISEILRQGAKNLLAKCEMDYPGNSSFKVDPIARSVIDPQLRYPSPTGFASPGFPADNR